MKFLACLPLLALGLSASSHVFTANAQVVSPAVPQFLQPATYSVPGATMAVLADVNGDGILDIVTANGFSGAFLQPGGVGVSVLIGNGDGTFQAARSVLATGNPNSMVVGDFNGDGKADIAIANDPNSTLVSILFGNGDGTFQAPISTDIGGSTAPIPPGSGISLVAADFNGDGKLDLAVTRADPTLVVQTPGKVLLNNGDGTFTVSATFPGYKVIAADVNGDGIQDLVQYSSPIQANPANAPILLGNGDGTFRPAPANPFVPLNTFPGEAFVGDFNGDGRLDIAFTDGGFVGICFLQPDGTYITQNVFFAANQRFTYAPFEITNHVVGDFNGDGKLDIASYFFVDYGVAFVNPLGSAAPGVTGMAMDQLGPNVTTPFVATGDLDGNGSPDLVVTTGGTVVNVLLNTGGHPPLLAVLSLLDNTAAGTSVTPAQPAQFATVGSNTITGQVTLGGPAPAGGTVVTLSSSSPAVFFPNGSTVTVAAGQQTAGFPISTGPVAASTPVTISASARSVTLASSFTLVPSATLTSLSAAPVSLFGLFGGNQALGTVTLSGPAADGTVIALTSANPAALSVPVNVAVAPGATTATFPLNAFEVAADLPVAVSASFHGTTASTSVTVAKELATVTVTKSQFVVNKSQLSIEATSTTKVPSLQVFNAKTGTLVGSIPSVGGGKFVGNLTVAGPFTSAAVQSSAGGLAIVAVPQK